MTFLRESLACSQDVPHAAGKWQRFLDDNSSHNRSVPSAPPLETGARIPTQQNTTHPTGGAPLHHNTEGPRKWPTAQLSLQRDNKIQHMVRLCIVRCPERVGAENEGVVTTSGDTGCCSGEVGSNHYTGGRQRPRSPARGVTGDYLTGK